MQLIKPYARLLSGSHRAPDKPFTIEDGIQLLRRIEYFGRISHASEDKQTDDSWGRFITAVVLDHGDWSIVEHASVSVDFMVDRGVTHELVRHRLFSMTQASTRFINYVKKMPPSFIISDGIENTDMYGPWVECIATCEETYRAMVAKGHPPQIARSVLPNALASRIAITCNLRNWRHFFLMRTTKETHPQMRQVTIPLLEEMQLQIPLLFDDIVPMARQVDNLKKPR